MKTDSRFCLTKLMSSSAKTPLLLLAILFAGILPLMANPISLSKARKIAGEFIQKKNNLRSSSFTPVLVSAPSAEGIETAGLRSANEEEVVLYYIFNDKAGQGFVMVSGDDQLPEVLGYATNGSFSTKDMPDNLSAFLQAYRSNLKILTKSGIKNKRQSSNSGQVSPLLGNIKWNQDFPWNSKTPLGRNGKNTPVGCVATATSQIMRYYQWPDKGEGEHSYLDESRRRSVIFNVNYDWKNMPEKFDDPKAATKEQIEALGTLCYHVGIAEDMAYGDRASGSFIQNVIRALRENFKYDKNVTLISRDLKTLAEWEKTIRNELDNNRPVLYSGYSSGGGHAFVCDGYDNEGLYHFNWGWGGMSDGYFDLNVLSPDALGIGGGSGGGFNEGQIIVVNFQPDKQGTTTLPNTKLEGQNLQVSSSYGPASCTFELRLTEILFFSTKVRIVIENIKDHSDKHIVYNDHEYRLHGLSIRPSQVKTELEKTKDELTLKPSSTYKVYAEAKAEDGQYYAVRTIQGTSMESKITTDEAGHIKNVSNEDPKPNISLSSKKASADLKGYEKSFIRFYTNNLGTAEKTINTVLYIVDRKSQKILMKFDKNVAYPLGSDNEAFFMIERLPIAPGTKVDIAVACVGQYNRTTILEDVTIEKAESVREGYVLSYNKSKWNAMIDPENLIIKGFSLEDVATKHKGQDIIVAPILTKQSYFTKEQCIINLYRIDKTWDGKKKELQIGISEDPDMAANVKSFCTVYNDQSAILSMLVIDANTMRPLSTISSPAVQVTIHKNVKPTYKIIIEESENGRVTLNNISDPNNVKGGTKVFLNVDPNIGYKAEKLLINGVNIYPETSFIIDRHTVIKATFVKKNNKVTILKYGEGTVNVEGLNGQKIDDVKTGTKIRITATPQSGHHLASLLVNGISVNNPHEITVDEDIRIIANFKEGEAPESAERIEQTEVTVFPNPATDFISFKGVESGSEIRIYSMTGQLMLTRNTEKLAESRIDISMLPSAKYIVVINGKSFKISKR